MKKLLTYPCDMPLIHKNHAHRARATENVGICYGIRHPAPVQAGYFVDIYPGEKRKAIPYELDLLDCDGETMKISSQTARKVLHDLKTLDYYNKSYSVRMKQLRSNIQDITNLLLVVNVDTTTLMRTYEYVDSRGYYVDDEAAALARIITFLSAEFRREDGPKFEVSPPWGLE